MTTATALLRSLVCVLPCLAAACASVPDTRGGPGDLPTSLQLGSAAFVSQQALPATYTCEGDAVSPPLRWSSVPSEAVSLVLVAEDADGGQDRTHWLVYNLPPSSDLSEGASGRGLPRGAAEGQNDDGTQGYRGPCPASGRHQYHFRLYALDTYLTEVEGPTRAQIEAAMQGHVLATGELIGTYQRTGQ